MKKFHQAPLAVLLTVSLLVLAGCSKPVLDYRNADLPDGLIYAQGANEPFTGTVTHVPDSFMFNDAKGYWRLLSDSDLDLISPSLLCTISVHKGYVDGKAICYLPRTDTKVIEASFDSGNLSGDFVYYANKYENKSDQLRVEVSFDGGQPDGTEKVYSTDTGRLVKKIDWSDGIVDGDYITYSKISGKPISEREYKEGKRTGTWKEYSKDGKKLLARMHFKDNFLDGERKTWDKNGNLLTDEVYADGEKVADRMVDRTTKPNSESSRDHMTQALSEPSASTSDQSPSPASIDKCVQGWVNAYHAGAAKSGVDAAVTISQANEWRDWCKSGKQAPGIGG